MEYPMWSPNKRAKYYKRYTADVQVTAAEVITVQKNRYVNTLRTFKWIDITPKEDVDEQPLTGLMVANSYMTIRTNSDIDFQTGDIVELPGMGLWIIQPGIKTEYVMTPKRIPAYKTLPLSSVG